MTPTACLSALLVTTLLAAASGVRQDEPADVVAALEAEGEFARLLAALDAAGLADEVASLEGVRLFAPTDAAFAKLPEDAVARLALPANRDWLREIVALHVVPRRVGLPEVGDAVELATLGGPVIRVARSEEGLRVQERSAGRSDIAVRNGAITVLDEVLLPAGFSLDGLTRDDGTRRLVDFTSEDVTELWYAVNDGVMGGRSRGGPEIVERRLIFSGTTVTDGGGFSSLRSQPRAWRLGTADGIRLRVKGDGRDYQLSLYQDEPEGSVWRRFTPTWRADIPTEAGSWTTVDVPFTAFSASWRGRPLDGPDGPVLVPARVRSLGFFVYDGRDGAFRLEVDRVDSYRAPR